MQPLADFDLARPATLAEAAALLAREGAMPLAGGTDLVPNLRRGLHAPSLLVDLGAVSGFGAVERSATHWRLGAGVTLAALASNDALAATLPAIVQAAREVAGPAHRSAATLGGNLCQDTRCVYYNQSAWWREANGYCLKRAPRSGPMARPAPQGGSSGPAEPDPPERCDTVCHVAPQGQRCHAAFEGDVAPALIACDAEVELAGPQGTRRLPLHQMYRDDGAAHLALARGELVVALQVPLPAPGSASGYRKQRVRGAMDFPLAGVAVQLRREGAALSTLTVAISGTNSNPIRLAGTEALLGRAVDDALLAELGKLVHKQVSPMRSTVTAAHHRRLVAAVAAQRLVRELWMR
ncbi:MAG TPA: FAD binding domain-containing protein [Burkholderiaceae bacterium]|nr:FAD binding domain-containing protein [Burkholderiaceae bacterium]